MKRITMVLFLALMLTGCGKGAGGTPTPTPTTMGAMDAAVALIQEDMKLRLTQQYIEAERLETGAKMTATQQVLDATATQQVHQERAEQTKVAQAATHQAWQVTVQAGYAEGTATAQAAMIKATATAEAEMIRTTATAAAAGTSTAIGYVQATGTAQYQATQNVIQATQEAAAWSAQATAQAAQAESAQLAANRERMTNGVIAWGPWALALILTIALGYTLWKKSQVGTIERDENGFMPGLMVSHGGQKILFSPDRMAGPVVVMSRNGIITAPQLVDAAAQDATTRRAQAVEAINALPPQAQRQGMGLMAQTFNGPAPRSTIEVLPQGQIGGWVDEAESKLSEEI